MSAMEVDQTVPSDVVLTEHFTLILNLCLMTKTDQDKLAFVAFTADQNEPVVTQRHPRNNVGINVFQFKSINNLSKES